MDDDPRSAYGFLAACGNGRGPKSEEKGGRRERVGVGMEVGLAVVVAMIVFWFFVWYRSLAILCRDSMMAMPG